MSSPEEIQRNIEATRSNLSTDVNRLAEKVSPGRVVGRRVDRVRGGAASMRERVMGSMPDTGAAGSQLTGVKDSVGNAAATVGDAASAAPRLVRRQAQGNPLAAGLVAFGIGMVLSSLAPATQQEQDLASQAEDKARGPLQATARDMAQQLKEPAVESAQQIKDTAVQSANDTADQAKAAVQDTKAQLQS